MGSGRAMCITQAHHFAETRRLRMRSELKAKTAAITEAWKAGFGPLKAENDQMQRDLASAFKSEMQMNEESLGDMREGLQK